MEQRICKLTLGFATGFFQAGFADSCLMDRTSGRGCLINMQLGMFCVEANNNTRFFEKACGVQSCRRAVASSGIAQSSCSSGGHSALMLVTLDRILHRNLSVYPVGCVLCRSLGLGIYACVSYGPTKTT